MLAALERVNQARSPDNPEGAALIEDVVVRFNENADAGTTGAYLATVNVDLLEGEIRASTNAEILAAWEAELPVLTDIRRLNLTEGSVGPAGRAIELRLSHDDLDTLTRASADLKEWFYNMPAPTTLPTICS